MGKSASKLKKRKESTISSTSTGTNLSWSKFASLPLRSKSRINKANKTISTHENKNSKHIDVLQWLKSMDLQQYEDVFKKFDGVEDLLEFSEADLKDLGVKISSHRATLISNLTILRAKYHGNFRRQPSVRHSVAVDNKITVEEDDKFTLIGIYFGCFGNKQSTTYEYLMANKAMKPLPIALSIIAGHVSVQTFVLYPAETYRYGAYIFLDIICIIIQGILNITIYLPVFHNLGITSIYEYLEKRFDRKARLLVSFMYILSVLLYLPFVIYTTALTCSAVTGINANILSPILCCICIVYTSISGLKGVVWTDNLQIIIMAVTMIVIFGLGLESSKGLTAVWEKGVEGQRLDIFNFNLDPTIRISFWSVVLGFSTLRLAMSSVTQSATQKFLTTPTFRDIKLAVVYHTVGLSIFSLFAGLLGLAIFAKYSDCDPLASKAISKSEQLVPYFVMDVAGHIVGLPGLFTAGTVSAGLSTLSITWNSVAGVIYIDFLKKYINRNVTEKTASSILKMLVVIQGIVGMCMVYIIAHLGEIYTLIVSFMGVTYGPTLGIFSLGLIFPRANSKGAFYGTLAGFLSSFIFLFPNSYFQYRGWVKNSHKPLSTDGCPFLNNTILTYSTNKTVEPYIAPVFKLSFMYHTLFGALITMFVGLLISYITNKDASPVDKILISPVSHFLYRRKKVSVTATYSSVQEALERVNTSSENE